VPLAALAGRTGLHCAADALRGRSVLIATGAQLPAVLAAMALDGIAGRLLLCPPDCDPAHLPAILQEAAVDAVVTDGVGPADGRALGVPLIRCGGAPLTPDGASAPDRATEWVLFTSGTTGRPKLVVHTLASLIGTPGPAVEEGPIWSTFYDVRRYGGISILLRALRGGSLVLSEAGEAPGAFLTRAGAAGVTHLTGTPSHWRRALMVPQSAGIELRYVRLSGEIADQPILDHLRARFPAAALVHAFATTEAGLAFEVHDGRAGFPQALLGAAGGTELRVVDGALAVRSGRTAARYLGGAPALRDADGWVDTGDMVVVTGGRAQFAGRRGGVINVGGQKLYPEEVEAVINRHPDVRLSRVHPRRSPITGAIVAAEVVLHEEAAGRFVAVRAEILAACRAALAAHKVPASVRQVPALAIAASGKLVREPVGA
jgi:acyl-CoA synthetase (AMP-forming)/AMP-acid ligase II